MKKLHSFAFYALIAPAMTLGASSLMAQQTTGGAGERQQQSTQRDQGQQDATRTSQRDQKRDGQSGMQRQSYMDSAPADGSRASDLIGADVKTSGDEDVGSVSDLIIDKDGQVVAIVVGVGGFLGMGEKDVAIGWDHVTRSGAADDQELRIDMTREQLDSAPKYEERRN